MAPLKLVVLSLVTMLVSCKGPTISDLMGAMETSMQNTISLTALVGQQTKDIKEITNLVDNAKKEIEDLKSKLTTSEEKSGKEIEALKNNSSTQEGQLAALKESMEDKHEASETKFEAVKNNSSISDSKLEALRESMEDEHEASETKFEAVKNNSSILDGKLEALRESMEDEHEASETKFTQAILALEKSIQDSEVKIISTHGSLRDASCVVACTGTTGKGSTNWYHPSDNFIYTKVDMSKCGFVAVPTVAIGFAAGGFSHGDSYSPIVHSKNANSFSFYITTTNGNAKTATSSKWHLDWVAVGYKC